MFKMVSKDEFDSWIEAYPKKLERSIDGRGDQPVITYNDFERAPFWPDSIVASYQEGRNNYAVLEDINSPVFDDGKRDTDTPVLDKNGVELREGDVVEISTGFTISKDGAQFHSRSETIMIRDRGTKYERWSFAGISNSARSLSGSMELIAKHS